MEEDKTLKLCAQTVNAIKLILYAHRVVAAAAAGKRINTIE